MRDAIRTLSVRLAWPFVAILPALVAARGMFATSSVFCYRDLNVIFYPNDQWMRRTIASGDAPFWDPFLAFGQSAAAEPLRQIFFPPAALLRFVPSEALGFNLLVGLPFPTAALGAFLLLRTRVAPSAAALGAVIYSCASTTLSTGSMPNLSWSAAIAPWTVWAAWEAARSKRGEWAALAALVVGLQSLAGEPVTLAATIVVAVAYAAACGETIREAAVAAVRTGGALAVGCALGAVQILPLVEAVRLSPRAVSAGPLLDWSLHPARLLEAIVPFPYANGTATPPEYDAWTGVLTNGREPFLLSHYVGIPAIALAAVGAVSGGRRFARFWLVTLVVALVCAVGPYTPVYPTAVRAFSVLALFRYPEKYTLVAVLALAALAAEGWQALATRRLEGLERWTLPAAVVALLAAAGAAVALAPQIAASAGASDDAATHTRTVVTAAAPLLAGLSLGVLGVAAALAYSPRRRQAALALGFALVALDLVGAGAWLNPQIDVGLLRAPAWAARAAASDGRYFSALYVGNYYAERAGKFVPEMRSDPDSLLLAVSAPAGTPYYAWTAMGTSSVAMYESRFGVRGVFAFDAPQLYPSAYYLFQDAFVRSAPERRAAALERIGVRTQLRAKPPAGPYGGGVPVPDIGSGLVYSSEEPFARAFVAPGSRVEPAVTAAMEPLFDPGFDFANVAVVDRDTPAAGAAGAPAAASARIVEDRPNLVRVRAEGGDGATLVLLDSYNPGWVAEVDGRPAEIARVDGLFRGVRLAAGAHDVTFRFRPRSLVVGAWISGLTALGLGLLAVVSIARRRRVTPEPEAA